MNGPECKDGIAVSRCPDCNTSTWPPLGFCSRCLQDTVMDVIRPEGVILECSKRDGEYFCMVEVGGSFRVMGSVTLGIPRPGKTARIRLNDKDGMCRFEMSVPESGK